jgi:hypothetical protein
VQKVIRHNLAIDVILWAALLQDPQRFGQMLVQRHGFVAQFADEQVLLLDLFLKRQCTLELLLRAGECGLGDFGGGFGGLDLFAELVDLGFVL